MNEIIIKEHQDAALLGMLQKNVQELHHEQYPEIFKLFEHSVFQDMI